MAEQVQPIQFPVDKEELGELRDSLRAMEAEPVFQLYLRHLQVSLNSKFHLLLRATSLEEVFRLQGEYLGIKKSLDALDEIKQKLQ